MKVKVSYIDGTTNKFYVDKNNIDIKFSHLKHIIKSVEVISE